MRIIEIVKGNMKSENAYIEEVRNYDILTEFMHDECVPQRAGSNVMIWLAEDGLLGEIECIYPKETFTYPIFEAGSGAKIIKGYPKVEVHYQEKGIEVYTDKTKFFILFEQERVYDCILETENLKFYLNNKGLIGVEANLS